MTIRPVTKAIAGIVGIGVLWYHGGHAFPRDLALIVGCGFIFVGIFLPDR